MTGSPRLTAALAAGILCLTVPMALHALPTDGSHPAHPERPAGTKGPGIRVQPPSDTAKPGDRTKAGERNSSPAARRKSLKGHSGATSSPESRRQFVPDQPWETEFFVDNDIPIPAGRTVFALASLSRR